ncbi:hypothetical protein ACFV9C_30095 [Kribbella sp. NPDC059898]|uniref:hypothetical protein n=1 Tax=Kribbella sp. NPDC059898 TaxID=3346995 RepID=UPI0036574F3A
MTDPTTPVDPKNQPGTAADDTTELPAVPAAEDTPSESTGNTPAASPAAGTTEKPAPTNATTTNATDAGATAGTAVGAGGAGADGAGADGAGADGAGAGGAPADASGAGADGSAVAVKEAGAGAGGVGGTGVGGAGADGKGGGVGGVGDAVGREGGGGKKRKGLRRVRLSGGWLTVGGAVVLLVVLAVLGYVWGLGPLQRLNTNRGINPPAKLAGLDRITDKGIRDQLQLDQTREALSRINNGKQATVEAYGTIDGSRMYVIIALRGKVDIDKTVADSGATPDKVKHVGSSTCVEASGNLPTQCYRGSNTLTVIAQSANEGVPVDQVAPVAEEAFKAMR